MNSVNNDAPIGILPEISPHFRGDGSLDASLPEARIQGEKIIEQLRGLLSRAGGVPVSEFSHYPKNLTEILGKNLLTQQLEAILGNPDLIRAGGRLVFGTPWKKDSQDTFLRVFYNYEQYEEFENRLISQVAESHNHIAYDAVVALPTGGVNLGIKAARAIGKPLHYAHVTSYDDSGNKGDVHMRDMEAFVASLPPSPARILLIDDLSDTGESLNFTKKFLEERGYSVETATIFEKEGTAHKPSFCVFRDFPKLWIVQPSEMYEGPVAGHNVYDIQNHPTTQKILEVYREVRRIIEGNNNIQALEFVVPAGSDTARVAMTVAKKVKDYWNMKGRFVTAAANDKDYSTTSVGADDTVIQNQTRVKDGVLSVMIDDNQIQKAA